MFIKYEKHLAWSCREFDHLFTACSRKKLTVEVPLPATWQYINFGQKIRPNICHTFDPPISWIFLLPNWGSIEKVRESVRKRWERGSGKYSDAITIKTAKAKITAPKTSTMKENSQWKLNLFSHPNQFWFYKLFWNLFLLCN